MYSFDIRTISDREDSSEGLRLCLLAGGMERGCDGDGGRYLEWRA